MSKRSRETAAKLSDARTASRLVTVARSGAADPLDGYVLDIGSRWCVLLVIEVGCADGWACIRTDDVRTVKPVRRQRVSRRLLKLDLRWPPEGGFDLDLALDGTTSDLLQSCAAAMPGELLGIHWEGEPSSPLYVGLPIAWRRKSVLWHDVNPDGRWDREPYRARYDPITRVEWGGRYLAALQRVAGRRPER